MTEFETDVLVLGGGPAGIWAAVAAAATGAKVSLVDKGFCGATGPAAYGPTRLWNIEPGQARAMAMQSWSAGGAHLGEADWMFRLMDETRRQLIAMAEWGCATGELSPTVMIEPDFWLQLRRRAERFGVRVLDHHPALQLLLDSDGVVSGAAGIAIRDGYRDWRVRAGAVVVATGGCAFLSGSAGTDGNTGDGHLMSAEVGAELSGMEFSAAYALKQPGRSVRESRHALRYATFYDESDQVVAESDSDVDRLDEVLAAIADGRRVFARLDRAPDEVCASMNRAGLDSAARSPLRPVLEGTVRGTGGLRIVSADCSTTVPGLYAAGDATSREAVAGATSGIGGQSGAWAMASGSWSGAGAAAFARQRGGVGSVGELPGAGLSPFGQVNPQAIIGLVQEHVVPLRRSYRRNSAALRDSMAELDGMWPGAVVGLGGSGDGLLWSRQAASMLAVARWATHSALARTESRGIHRRIDHPAGASAWQVRLESGGLDDVWVRAGDRLPG